MKNTVSSAPKSAIVYVASSVTNAPDSYRLFVRDFKSRLGHQSSAVVFEWIEKDETLGEDFFRRDLDNVRTCDAMIALVDYPSIGVGMELNEAFSRYKPVLCLYKTGSAVSRLLQKAHEERDVPLQSYASIDEAVQFAAQFLQKYAK